MIAARERLTARTGVPRDAVPPLARRAGSGKCLDLRGGRGTTPRLLPGEPQTSLPSPPPLKKRVKKQTPTHPHPRGAAVGPLRRVLPARLRDSSVDAGSSPVPGAAEPQTSVTWIFTHQEAATPAFPSRSDWTPRRTLVRAQRRGGRPVTHSSPRRSPARLPDRPREPS